MRRAFDLDVLRCPRCAGRMQLIATLDDPAVIQWVLAHLGLPGARDGPPLPSSVSTAPAKQPALPLGKPVAKQLGPWTHARVEVCPTSAWQPEVDNSRPVRRAADLTFPTRSGRIGATSRLLSALCQGNLRGAMSENGSWLYLEGLGV
jgi:hypothetical protein